MVKFTVILFSIQSTHWRNESVAVYIIKTETGTNEKQVQKTEQ